MDKKPDQKKETYWGLLDGQSHLLYPPKSDAELIKAFSEYLPEELRVIFLQLPKAKQMRLIITGETGPFEMISKGFTLSIGDGDV